VREAGAARPRGRRIAEYATREPETLQAGVPRRAEHRPITPRRGRGGLAADVLALQRQAGNRAVCRLVARAKGTGLSVQRIVANNAAPGLTNNMTADFITKHILNQAASNALVPPNTTPPRQKPDGTYVRDRTWANTDAAYQQALNRFNNIGANTTHILEIANNFPEYAPGKRMNVKRALRPEPGHVDMVVQAGWRFEKVPENLGTPGLRENVGGALPRGQEAVLRTTSASQRSARVGVRQTQINHFPGDKNPFLH
jgi:hypothetical protein